MENHDGLADTVAATEDSSAAAIFAGDETGRLDQALVGVVESSPASGVSHRLGLGELKDEDLLSILKCAKSLYYEEDPDSLLGDIANNFKACFRLDPGLMILEIVNRGKEKELFVFWLEGKGLFRQMRNIKKALFVLARANNCNRLGASVMDLRLAKLLLKASKGQITGYQLSVEI